MLLLNLVLHCLLMMEVIRPVWDKISFSSLVRAFAGRKWEVVDSDISVAFESRVTAFVGRMVGSDECGLEKNDSRMIFIF